MKWENELSVSRLQHFSCRKRSMNKNKDETNQGSSFCKINRTELVDVAPHMHFKMDSKADDKNQKLPSLPHL